MELIKPITLIYADDCLDCAKMESMINQALEECGKKNPLVRINSEDSEAITVAIDNGISDIPACIIGDIIMFGKRGFKYKSIKKAISQL